MMIFLRSRVFIVILFILGSLSAHSQYVDRIAGSPYPASRKPDTLFIVDDAKLSEDQQVVVQSLQGLLAQYRPKIYRVSDEGSLMWLSELHSRYGVFMIDSFKNDYLSLVRHFKDSINGYILCANSGSSINAAISLSSLYNAITVPEKLQPDFPFLKKVLDVRTWTEEDVYAKYHDSLSKNILIYQKESVKAYLGDYGVFSGAFRFYEPVKNNFTQAVFKDMNTDAALLGWGDNEHDLVDATSKTSVMVHAADFANNLSVLTNVNADYDQQDSPFAVDTVSPAVHTVCFLMTDGDNIQWLTHQFATSKKWYNSDDSGSVPLGWTISPALSELAAPIMKYVYDNASNSGTGRDYFVAAPSGLGYLYPESYPDLTTYADLMNKYLKKSDLSIVNVIGNQRSPDLSAYTQCSNVDAVFYYMYSDYSGWKGKIMWNNDKPIIGGRYSLWGDKETPQTLAQKLNNEVKNQFQPEGYSLIPVHVWTNTVEDVKKCAAMLGGDVRVVAPDDFVRLIKRNLGVFLYQNYPNPLTDRTMISFKVSYPQHVTVIVFDASGNEVTTVFDGMADAGITKAEFFKTDIMTPGVYVCTLVAGQLTKSIKIQVD
ncbi:MAG: GxGYxY sequence motif-containing protein [Bacteroidota bacterium]|nr:GxGYxY sequence motif-containing protein [Bacteroidota bacterium]